MQSTPMLRHRLYPILLVGALKLPSADAAENSLRLETIELEDGDTFVVQIAGTAERIQLSGIDAPEDTDNAKFQHDLKRTGLDRETLLALGRAATAHLRALLQRNGPFVVVYDPDQRDRYGRITAQVSDAAGHSLNASMVEEGYAAVLSAPGTGAPLSAPLAELEANAIATDRGLWGEHREAALAWRGLSPNPK